MTAEEYLVKAEHCASNGSHQAAQAWAQMATAATLAAIAATLMQMLAHQKFDEGGITNG